MTIRINIEPHNNPVIERYENDLKVGSRKLTTLELQKMFASELPINELLNILIHERTDEFELMMSYTNHVDSSVTDFISALFNHINVQLNNKFNSTGIDVDALLKHSFIEAETFDIDDFSRLIKMWLHKLSSSGINLSEPLSNVFSQLRYQDMPLSSILGILDGWIRRFKYYVDSDKLTADEVNVFVSMIDVLVKSDHEDLKRQLINLTLKHSKDANEMMEWLKAGLSAVLLDDLEAEIERRKTNPSKKAVRFFAPLPRNASFMAATNQGNVFYYDLQKNNYFVKYQSKIFKEKVGFPRLLFAISVDESFNVISAKLAAVRGEETLDTSTKLYRYPYSNVYSDGKLCFSCKDILCDDLPSAFLSATNNSHLNPGGFEIFKKYEGVEFDEEELVPLNLTVADFY